MTGNRLCLSAFTLLLVIIPISMGLAVAAEPDTGGLSAASSSQSPPINGVGEALNDAAITSKVKIKLLSDQQMAGSSINVTTMDGVVTLKGVVSAAPLVEEAAQTARSVAGVKTVNNQLTMPMSINGTAASAVVPSTGTGAPETSDNRINLRIRDKLFVDQELKGAQIGIATINGVVRLFGEVQSPGQKNHAILIANQTAGVREVDSSALSIQQGQ